MANRSGDDATPETRPELRPELRPEMRVGGEAMADGGQEYTHPSDAGAPHSASQEQRTYSSWRLIRRRQIRQQWQEEFPYHWSADDLVTRRDTLRFLVSGTGALFLASAALAITGAVRSSTTQKLLPIAKVGEVPFGGYKVFNYPDSFADGILVNLPNKGLVAYSDVCTHLSCAVLYQPAKGEFYCPCHEGRFDAATGQVLGGPPTRPLPTIQLSISGDTVYAVRQVER
ncbi:MAG TPA: ubiquinol-cytochrome c reductase iron-sulfur subunit [Ktedonobacterales bacterium]|nr:ubiquinol-cytochrome c reductase iron-sulfur subunit [Ktedonobacterales bacterium]HEX5569832.1 ubiquinol-cytochrome c reductase iron-sulfur subunit [Ktedonobacterales bacterium]